MLEDPAHNVTPRKWQGTITSEAKRVTMAEAFHTRAMEGS